MKSVEFLKRSVCAALVLSALPAVTAVPLFAEDLNAIILRVNDEITTHYDYRERKAARVRAIQESELPLEERQTLEADAGKATMREILDEMLLLSRARQLIIEPSQGRARSVDGRYAQPHGPHDRRVLCQGAAQRRHVLEDFRERTSRSIRVNAVIQREVRSKVEVDDEWLQRTYRERQEEFRVPAKAKVQEIVIPADKLSGERAREVAEAMRTALAGGESMADVVARLGGGDAIGPVDLGWVAGGGARSRARGRRRRARRRAPSPRRSRRAADSTCCRFSSAPRARSGRSPRSRTSSRADEQSRLFQEKMRTYLADLEARAYLLENTPPEAVGYREVTRDDANDPLAAFAPKRAPAPAPAGPAAGRRRLRLPPRRRSRVRRRSRPAPMTRSHAVSEEVTEPPAGLARRRRRRRRRAAAAHLRRAQEDRLVAAPGRARRAHAAVDRSGARGLLPAAAAAGHRLARSRPLLRSRGDDDAARPGGPRPRQECPQALPRRG